MLSFLAKYVQYGSKIILKNRQKASNSFIIPSNIQTSHNFEIWLFDCMTKKMYFLELWYTQVVTGKVNHNNFPIKACRPFQWNTLDYVKPGGYL